MFTDWVEHLNIIVNIFGRIKKIYDNVFLKGNWFWTVPTSTARLSRGEKDRQHVSLLGRLFTQ